MPSLFDEVKSEQNIFSAWRHVKASALRSSNKEMNGIAADFEHNHQRHLRRIISQLREGRFEFDKAKGVLKDAKARIALGKDPRPLTIGTLKNRIVQRAILQILQPTKREDPKKANSKLILSEDMRLGKINDVNRSKFGVGGLVAPYGGVKRAIETILDGMSDGAKYYYRSDIKSFFTKIPTPIVTDFVLNNTKDENLTRLFERSLIVELDNENELGKFKSLFPAGGIGVAQGSALSTFAGNVLLYDLDQRVNELDVICVRYVDDILMIARTEESIDRAKDLYADGLRKLGFDIYSPTKGSDKAARGQCVNAIDFLGCTLQPNRCVPSSASARKFKEDVGKIISESKRKIKKFCDKGGDFDPKYSQISSLDLISKKVQGWQKSFSFCTESSVFSKIDADLRVCIDDYISVVRRLASGKSAVVRMSVLGIPSMELLYASKKSQD
ncbi:hypothetical protein J5J86_07150 [Aquabacter sp. L1I39]|uniref:reverse transcriptase domain-containing protein n=1 Tax=Aquabacter sp. L1I39 TaxID=2820278 RepID=UPI001ADCE8C5|nr:reverse transcriptase domain-containing protein [Aquabacter sp. L1I39]QTL05072.1 hypothetical protein J5J86_07150 [Aquabacter sp. L1I39]